MSVIWRRFDLHLKPRITPQQTEEDDTALFDTSTAASAGDETLLQPSKPRDFELFYAMVAFISGLFTPERMGQFSAVWQWVPRITWALSARSAKNPHIAGFYRFFTVFIKVAEEARFFDELDALALEVVVVGAAEVPEPAMELDEPSSSTEEPLDSTERRQCVTTIQCFIEEVTQKLSHFKGDLLAACIEMVLSVPAKFVDMNRHAVGPLTRGLEFGHLNLKFAFLSLDALERWVAQEPEAVVPILESVLPHFDAYLHLVPDSETTEAGGGLLDLQERVVALLGKVGGYNHAVVNESKEVTAPWDTDPRLKMQLPSQYGSMYITFDAILPRITTLCLQSGKRQTKVAAGELLHALVLFMVGTNAAHKPDQPAGRGRKGKGEDEVEGTQMKVLLACFRTVLGSLYAVWCQATEFFRLYEHIFPVLLRLAVDPEQVLPLYVLPLCVFPLCVLPLEV